MIYLYLYLAVGVVVFPVVYYIHRPKKENTSKFLGKNFESVIPNREKLSNRIVKKILAPTLGAILLVAFWPLIIYIEVTEVMRKKGFNRFRKKREFAVLRKHLLERLTQQEIESREVVIDPLKATPDLPFGHLNAAWREFLKNHTDDSELWSFEVYWWTPWGLKELRSGYVVVKYGKPRAHFLTVWKEITDNADGRGKKVQRVNIPSWRWKKPES